MTSDKEGRFVVVVDLGYLRVSGPHKKYIATAVYRDHRENGRRCCLFDYDTMTVAERSGEVDDGGD